MSARALEDKAALVTGGSRGIGRAIAERLAQDGAAVGVTYARDETAASETVENIRKNGGRAFALQAGLGERGDAAASGPPSTPRPRSTCPTGNSTSSSTTPASGISHPWSR